MADLRIGLVGVGGIGAVHLERWRQLAAEGAGVAVAAVCDADTARAEATGLPAYTDLQSLLARAEVDAIDLCTPPKWHAPLAIAALDAGLPTFCEKPLARTPAEAGAMIAAAERAGKPLLVGFCHRFHEPIERLKALIDAGDLGRPVAFRNRFGARFADVHERWFSSRDIAGGGVMTDTSVHSIDLFRHLIGEISEAKALLSRFDARIEAVEDTSALIVHAESGALGVIEASWQTPFSANIVEVYGETGAASVDYNSNTLRYRVSGGADWIEPTLTGQDRFLEELRHFAAVARGEAAPRVTAADGLRATEVLHAAYTNAAGS